MKKSDIIFNEEAHTYTAPDGRQLSGVTPIVAWYYPTTYEGISDEVLQAAADYGTKVHKACEAADAGIIGTDRYVQDYIDLKAQAGLTTIANEYLIDDGSVASKIDLIAKGPDCRTWLLDIKTTSQVHRENVRLQLSIYAAIGEAFGINADALGVVWLPKPQYGAPAIIPVSIIPADVCRRAITAYLNNDTEARAQILEELEEPLPAEVLDAEAALCNIIAQQKEMEEQRKRLEAGLLQLMQTHNVKKYETKKVVITRILSSTRKSVDTKRLQEDYPVLVEMYMKETKTKESIKITVR